LYGVLLPGPHIGRQAGDDMRRVRDAGFEVGLHTFDHVKWQDFVVNASPEWTRTEFERGVNAFADVFGEPPKSHAAAGWQINDHALRLEQEYGLDYASDTRGGQAFYPKLTGGTSTCVQIPTTLPTFDELLGRDGVNEGNVAEAVFTMSNAAALDAVHTQVFTLHAELEGLLLLDAFDSLLSRWRRAGAVVTRMAEIHAEATRRPLPSRAIILGTVPGRSGQLAMDAAAVAGA
jgi:peptidoglycan/xylan/chitin deacetylase (PgdA/CDA1 family)